MVALRAITGMAASAQKAAMKAQAGQILLLDPELIVNHLQAAVVLTLIGITELVRVEAPIVTMAAVAPHRVITVEVLVVAEEPI